MTGKTSVKRSRIVPVNTIVSNNLYKKKKIPAALRQSVWLHCNGKQFEAKCCVVWCQSIVNVFTFEAGHNIPESKGGETSVANLRPICAACNKSMGNRYSIDEFNQHYICKITQQTKSYNWWHRITNIFRSKHALS